jgi:hypothetical protein
VPSYLATTLYRTTRLLGKASLKIVSVLTGIHFTFF